MTDPLNVLFLCTGNSARSILGEALMTKLGAGRFRGFSAGSDPKNSPHPAALSLLTRKGHETRDLRSKTWDVFEQPGAPVMHYIFTVCDSAANETCPIWPGQPISAHWGLPDPAAVTGPEPKVDAAFAETYDALYERIEAFINLPHQQLDEASLQEALSEIGKG